MTGARRVPARVAVAGIIALALGACTTAATPTPPPLREAAPRYAALLGSISAALTRDHGAQFRVLSAAQAAAGATKGTCVYVTDRLISETFLGRAQPWSAVQATVDGALQSSGFGPTSRTDGDPGGWLVVEASDPAGARLTVRAKGQTEVWIEVLTSGSSCDLR